MTENTLTYTEKIQDVIDSSDVALFMKGTPDAIMCGNSERALGALRRAGAPITAVDVLLDMQIRETSPRSPAGRRSRRCSSRESWWAAPTSSRTWSAPASSSRP